MMARPGSSLSPRDFVANLTGAAVRPTPVITSATGTASIRAHYGHFGLLRPQRQPPRELYLLDHGQRVVRPRDRGMHPRPGGGRRVAEELVFADHNESADEWTHRQRHVHRNGESPGVRGFARGPAHERERVRRCSHRQQTRTERSGVRRSLSTGSGSTMNQARHEPGLQAPAAARAPCSCCQLTCWGWRCTSVIQAALRAPAGSVLQAALARSSTAPSSAHRQSIQLLNQGLTVTPTVNSTSS